MAAGVGLVAIDNDLEITLLESVAENSGRNVEVVLRLNPGVDVHTHHKMRTGATDSKFGFPVWDGQAEEAASRICRSTRLALVGYHAHVGSQIFDPTLVARTIDVIMEFAGHMHRRWGAIPNVVIPGGGFGVADDASGADVPIDEWARVAAVAIERGCLQHGLPRLTSLSNQGAPSLARPEWPSIQSARGKRSRAFAPTSRSTEGWRITSVPLSTEPAMPRLLPIGVRQGSH